MILSQDSIGCKKNVAANASAQASVSFPLPATPATPAATPATVSITAPNVMPSTGPHSSSVSSSSGEIQVTMSPSEIVEFILLLISVHCVLRAWLM